MDNYKRITHNDQDYSIINIRYKDNQLPILLDWDDFVAIEKLKKKWKCNGNGFIYCQQDGNDYYLHELIMSLRNKDGNLKLQNKPIVHINRIGLDNRRENLIYDMINKDVTKNAKKKKRTIVLPKKCGIDPDTIPTYIWYMRPDSSHDERFMVNIGDVTWKTTSSSDLSLKYKLEEAKMFLRHLLRSRPDLHEEYSMNGDFNREGIELLNTYYDIIHSNGYSHIKKVIPDNNTFDLLRPDYDSLTDDERYTLYEARKYI
ncbi:hypothetical protein Indivirus_4_9 [Indivirus ILV1]|uniref:Uncharacterized protein n=1 Tax=Indivirus ILV1 TaxID=1977633 RepID=A0A1V0SDP5_9VIRU|nr:hypothetical protein Indivirus_4_9 [Indivirus ILV1]